jgi:hypothetical protein
LLIVNGGTNRPVPVMTTELLTAIRAWS